MEPENLDEYFCNRMMTLLMGFVNFFSTLWIDMEVDRDRMCKVLSLYIDVMVMVMDYL